MGRDTGGAIPQLLVWLQSRFLGKLTLARAEASPASSLPQAKTGIVPSAQIPIRFRSLVVIPARNSWDSECPDVLLLPAVLPEGFSTAFPFLFRTFPRACDAPEPRGDSCLLQLDNFRRFWNCGVVWAALPAVPASGLSLLREYPPGEYPGIPGPHPSGEGRRRGSKGREERGAQIRAGMGSLGRAGRGRGPAAAGPALGGFCTAGSCPKTSLISDLSIKSTCVGWELPLSAKNLSGFGFFQTKPCWGIWLQGRGWLWAG